MSEIAELRELQREYVEKRDLCYARVRRQQEDLSNCSPGIATIHACQKQADGWLADAAQWQQRIDAIQRKLDEVIKLDKASEPSAERTGPCGFSLDQCRCQLPVGHDGMHECADHRFSERPLWEPQGEPSDAQREVAMDEAWGGRAETRPIQEKWNAQHWFDAGWRAALRAAGVVGQGGEKG